MIMQAPFTDDQVHSLAAYQQASTMHPFTCPNRGDDAHPSDPAARECRLIVTRAGWWCGYCTYDQSWAHAFMGDWSWRQPAPHMVAALLGHDRVRR